MTSGEWVFAGGLLPPDTATVVRAQGGKVVMTDGPFAESKEQIGGFWVIKATDLDAALEIAGRGSAACGGPVVIRGDLTPECAAAVTAVLEALGKKKGPEDDRNEGQRFHDALAEACHLLLRARLVPDRAGADTQVIVHVPIGQLRQLPGAPGLEDAWLRAKLGEPADPGTAYLTGKDAEVAARTADRFSGNTPHRLHARPSDRRQDRHHHLRTSPAVI